MRFTAIETTAWETLKQHIQALTQTMRTLFGEQVPYLDLFTMAMCAKYSASAREPCSTIGIRVLCLFMHGHKCYYKRADIEALLAKSNSKRACRWNTK